MRLIHDNAVLVDTPEAAEIIGVKPQTMRVWRSERLSDKPQAITIGRSVFYPLDQVQRYADTGGRQ